MMKGPQDEDDQLPAASQNPARRRRAPTITIDTSAVSPPLLEPDAVPLRTLSNHAPASQEEEPSSSNSHPPPPAYEPPPTDLRPTQSFESKESRPVSAHNVSSPTSKWGDLQAGNFLSVPNPRSRGNSVNSDDQAHSPTSYSGDTHVPSSAPSEEGRQPSTVHGSEFTINDEEALKPDPGTEADFDVIDNKFAFTPGQLNKLLNPKSFQAFKHLTLH